MTLHQSGLALAIAVVAVTALPACSTWNDMTDRMAGRSTSADTASGSRGMMGGASSSGCPMGGPSTGGCPMGGSSMGGSSMGGTSTGGSGMAASGGTDGNAPGGSMTALRGAPTSSGAILPSFRSYNECRAWVSGQPSGSIALNSGPMQGGEVTLADQDICARFPRG